MTRLYYDDDLEPWEENLSAGALQSAIRGKRGQQLLRDLTNGLDALPSLELSAGALEDEATGCCCALGAVRRFRGEDAVPLWFHPMEEGVNPADLAKPFNIAKILAWAVVQVNEDADSCNDERARRRRWQRVRDWAVKNLIVKQS
jgi:hypothetical protein